MSQQNTRAIMTLDNVALTTVLGTTPEIPFEEFAAGSILIPAGSPITSLTWYGSQKQSDQPSGDSRNSAASFVAAYDSAGVAVTQTVVASRAYPIPTALQGYAALKCVVDAAGTVKIVLKS